MIGGGFGGLVAFALAALHFFTGRLVEQSRGRLLQTVIAVVHLGNVPVGLAYGLYALWVCWFNEEAKHTFA